jgi:hypothetical protein
MNIFIPKYASIFTSHGDSVDHLGSIITGIGKDFISADTKAGKEEASEVVRQLLHFDIIKVLNWGSYQWMFENMNLNKKDIGDIAKNMYFKVKGYEQYWEMVYFEYTEWYWKYHNDSGITINTDWDWFNNEFVPGIKAVAEMRLLDCDRNEI